MIYNAPVTHLPWRAVPGQVCDREGYSYQAGNEDKPSLEQSLFNFEQQDRKT
jgi:hypothetical protein